MSRFALAVVPVLSLFLVGGCSRVQDCGGTEASAALESALDDIIARDLAVRFGTPFLTPEATQALVALFSPDAQSFSAIRKAAVDEATGKVTCVAQVQYRYEMEGRLERARSSLGAGSISGQDMRYMLEGLPYSKAVERLSEGVEGEVRYSVQRTEDGKIVAEVSEPGFALFAP